MIIYEVNLVIDDDVFAEFGVWLKKHIAEMLQFKGFVKANLLKEESEALDPQQKLTVQYYVRERNALEHYLLNHAPKMREEGLRRFNTKFSVSRRILSLQQSWAIDG
ncbi:DUF4286 family protein [Legionella impletisoli]|uniref:DUF4286 domain-containing protein n=1 Tax=Legionella impletisoli TaxID=343510 RepID=A0A917NC68_9GAMM|nr:DUF4286 family protein [Legionella impletisoli]GGI88040.1 hypothetical protein GCM10007966_16000 [Legionella impletisoli]